MGVALEGRCTWKHLKLFISAQVGPPGTIMCRHWLSPESPIIKKKIYSSDNRNSPDCLPADSDSLPSLHLRRWQVYVRSLISPWFFSIYYRRRWRISVSNDRNVIGGVNHHFIVAVCALEGVKSRMRSTSSLQDVLCEAVWQQQLSVISQWNLQM